MLVLHAILEITITVGVTSKVVSCVYDEVLLLDTVSRRGVKKGITGSSSYLLHPELHRGRQRCPCRAEW